MEWIVKVLIYSSVYAAQSYGCKTNDLHLGGACWKYGEGVCSSYLGSAFVKSYPTGENNVLQEDLKRLQVAANIILTSSHGVKCEFMLMDILCHVIFPVCYRGHGEEDVTYQSLCLETCLRLHSGGCGSSISEIMTSINQETFFLGRKTKNLLRNIMKIETCMKSTLYPAKASEPVPECFYLPDPYRSEIKREQCLSDVGESYHGTHNTAISGRACKPWASTCTRPSLLNTTSLSGDANFCRNPNGYRIRPWCFTNDTAAEWEFCAVPSCRSDVTDAVINGAVVGIAVAACLFFLIVLLVFLSRRRYCSKDITPYGVKVINVENIKRIGNKAMSDAEDLLVTIDKEMFLFRNRLCTDCLSDLLVNSVESSCLVGEAKEIVRAKVWRLVKELKDCQRSISNVPERCEGGCALQHALLRDSDYSHLRRCSPEERRCFGPTDYDKLVGKNDGEADGTLEHVN